MWLFTKPKEIRPGLITSLKAAYTAGELRELLKDTKWKNYDVSGNPIGIKMRGLK